MIFFASSLSVTGKSFSMMLIVFTLILLNGITVTSSCSISGLDIRPIVAVIRSTFLLCTTCWKSSQRLRIPFISYSCISLTFFILYFPFLCFYFSFNMHFTKSCKIPHQVSFILFYFCFCFIFLLFILHNKKACGRIPQGFSRMLFFRIIVFFIFTFINWIRQP